MFEALEKGDYLAMLLIPIIYKQCGKIKSREYKGNDWTTTSSEK